MKRIEGGSRLAGARWKSASTKAKDQLLSTNAGQKAQAWSKDRGHAMETRLDRLGETASGQKLAGASRAVGTVAAKIPGVSAMADSVSISNGVDVLTEAVKADPGRAEPKIHLVLAIRRTQRDMAQVRAAKAIMKPQTLITRTVLQKSATLGSDDELSMQEKLLRAAFKQAMTLKKDCPSDGENLHVLSRVYLLQEMPDTARQLARLSLAAGVEHPGDVYVTLANTESLAGSTSETEQYAELAAKHGSTLGYSVLAELAMQRDLAASERVKEYARLADLVDPRHEERYYGVRLDPDRLDAMRRLAHKHKSKAAVLKDAAGERAAELKDRRASAEDHRQTGTQPPAPAPPADWYPDPLGIHGHRYWDGSAWTDHVSGGASQHEAQPPGSP